MRYAAYASRASYKGILDKTRCTYDEMEFYAPWNARRNTKGERDSLTVSGLRAKGKIRGFLECRAKRTRYTNPSRIQGYFNLYLFFFSSDFFFHFKYVPPAVRILRKVRPILLPNVFTNCLRRIVFYERQLDETS